MYCALTDGSIDRQERQALQRWKRKIADMAPGALRSRLDSALELRIVCAENGVTDANLFAACHQLCTLPAAFRLQVMTMAFEVVAADGSVRSSEVLGLKKVARQLLVADADFRELERRHLAALRSSEPASSEPPLGTPEERLFGIHPAWSQEQKLDQLTKEFAKTNSRMQSMRDEAQRARCRERLKAIAEYRDELLNGRKPASTPPTLPSTPKAAEPPPIASKEELLLGIDPTLSIPDRLARLDEEEARWRGRLVNQLSPAAKEKCLQALQAVAQLRDAYRNQA
jgi:uncharacterized tellurite resistance protein B-like protein